MASFISFLLSLTWQDLVDVLLCSYIVFRLYVLFSGTAVLRVLIGIGLLVAAQRFAAFLGLVLTSWAIQGITAAAALIIIVVFRNEIRSVLQARNLKAILWGSPLKENRAPVDTIAEAVRELARKRCGALLVFPGRDDISDLLHSSTALDCLVSREMLLSIFWHGNPLHDGATVIQDSRISRAAAVLPVSNRDDLPSWYGTRHRAALGLAERCDALVLAVSEERGTITACRAGRMTAVDGAAELARMLQEHLQKHEESRNYQSKEKRNMAAAACASLAVVGMIWFGFTRGTDTFMAFDVPLEYINRDPALDIIDASVNSVKLHLGGSGSLVKSLRPEQVHVRIDLGGAAFGMHSFTISGEQIQMPPGVLVKKVEPSSIEVVLDAVVQKKLPVQVDWTGRLPDTMLITACDVDPPEILVSGPQQTLAAISTLYTEKTDVEPLTRSDTLTAPLLLTPPSLRILSGQDRVTVRITVQRRQQ